MTLIITKKNLSDKKILMTSIIAIILIFGSIPLDASALTLDETAKLTASDAAVEDFFGLQAAISGDTIVVGAQGNDDAGSRSGSVYIYKENGATWTEEAKLTASDAAVNDLFGASVAISGDTVVVGAPSDESFTGSAYVYTRSGTVWTEEAKLTASDGDFGDEFGVSIAISGDTVVVGSASQNSSTGAAYVFTRSGTVWTEEAKLTASDGTSFDNFGFSVSVYGDTAVSGAFADESFIGAAYVFTRSGTTWTEEAKLTASDGAADDFFGLAVSVSGDTTIAGALGDDSFTGSAYVFTRSGTTWTEEQKLTASDAAIEDLFGIHVSVSGDNAVIGAEGDEVLTGAAYVFTRSGTTWTEDQKLTASDGDIDDEFGLAVSISGDKAVIGAFGDDGLTGSAYVFEPAAGVPDTDSDGIFNEIDLQPAVFSDDFDDTPIGGTSDGSIVTRGDQVLTITEEANPDGIKVNADISGGVTPATVEFCSAVSSINFDPGDESIVTCSSVNIKVINGQVEATLFDDGANLIEATLDAGDEFTFDPDAFTLDSIVGTADISITTSIGTTAVLSLIEDNSISYSPESTTITASASNVADIDIIVDGEDFTISAGDNFVLDAIQSTEAVIEQLDTIINDNPGTSLADKLEDVKAKTQTVLDELNKTPPDNQAAVGNIEGAVGDIEAAVDSEGLDETTGNDLMDQLAGVARQLAVEAIDEAVDNPNSDSGEIADSQQFLADGDALRADTLFKDAVNKYKDALAKAESALP